MKYRIEMVNVIKNIRTFIDERYFDDPIDVEVEVYKLNYNREGPVIDYYFCSKEVGEECIH
jgi:hypothetical protein